MDVAVLPNIVAGYGDGTVRMFDLNKVEMVLKMQPHAASVSAIGFSADGKIRIYFQNNFETVMCQSLPKM